MTKSSLVFVFSLGLAITCSKNPVRPTTSPSANSNDTIADTPIADPTPSPVESPDDPDSPLLEESKWGVFNNGNLDLTEVEGSNGTLFTLKISGSIGNVATDSIDIDRCPAYNSTPQSRIKLKKTAESIVIYPAVINNGAGGTGTGDALPDACGEAYAPDWIYTSREINLTKDELKITSIANIRKIATSRKISDFSSFPVEFRTQEERTKSIND